MNWSIHFRLFRIFIMYCIHCFLMDSIMSARRLKYININLFKFHSWTSKIPTLCTEIYVCKNQKIFTTFSEHWIMFFAITLCNYFTCESLQTLYDCAHDVQCTCSSLCFCPFHWHPVQQSWNLVWEILLWSAVIPDTDHALAKNLKRTWKQWILKQMFKLGKN